MSDRRRGEGSVVTRSIPNMFAVLYLPDFGLQAVLRHEPAVAEKPVALVDPGHATPRVFLMTAAARVGGVEIGQTAVQAMARCREVVIRHRSLKQETAATEAVLQVAFGFSPHLELTGPGTVTLDLRGLAELQDAASDGASPNSTPRLAAWAQRLQTVVRGLGLQVRIGTGPTPTVARHAARWSDGIELVTDAPAFIASLPVAALEPSAHVASILQQWGVRTVGELLALGQAELADRFGLEAFGLFAAASAGALRPLHLVRPVECFEESLELEFPVETLEPLLFLLRRFTGQIGCRLEACGFVAETLHLTLRLESGAVLERRLRIPQPTRVPDALFGMLHTHLESVRTDTPIVAVGLAADPARPEQRQFSLFEAALRDPNQFHETLARLSALVGADRVGTPQRDASHRPDAFKLMPPDFENAPPAGAVRAVELLRPTPQRRLRPAVRTTVERERLAAQGVSVHARPVALRGPLASGTITISLGPWCSSGHWWEPDAWSREEWDVQTQRHQVVRLACRNGEWTVEAIMD